MQNNFSPSRVDYLLYKDWLGISGLFQESNLSAPFRNLLLEVWGNKRTDFRPEDFKSSLGTKFSQFEGYRQVFYLSCAYETTDFGGINRAELSETVEMLLSNLFN